MLFVCPRGAEAHLEAELRRFGAKNTRVGRAQVRCEDPPTDQEAGIGGLTVALRMCLGSHVASRVLWPVAKFSAEDKDALYEGARQVPWHQYIDPRKTIAVRVRRTEGALGHGPFVGQVIKDALVDVVRDHHGDRPSVERDDPDVAVVAAVVRGEVELSFDLSGDSLHERHIRQGGGAAPIKENLAALMLLLAEWPARAAAGWPLVDPMCGSGTLLIEAALLARGMPPNALRPRFGVDGLAGIPDALWRLLRTEAKQQYEEGRARAMPAKLYGFDADHAQISRARRAFSHLGLAGDVALQVADVTDGIAGALQAEPLAATGLVVANTPYGERIGGERAMREARLSAFGAWLKNLRGWHAAILVGERADGFSLGLRAHKIHALFNGPIDVSLLHLRIDHPSDASQAPTEAKELAPDFVRRVKKNERHRNKSASREGWGAYRVYDADVPEYRAAIDIYQAINGTRHVYLQPYAAPSSVDQNKAQMRVRHMVVALPHALDVSPNCIKVTERARQRDNQYTRKQKSPTFFWMQERGMAFCVSLDAYVDTGLYIDLRDMRALMRRRARDKRVLNLFGYTGSMSIAAAHGGARASVTVDKSNRYLDWAAENFNRNGMDPRAHRLVRADIKEFLASDDSHDEAFDLIYIGAPTFSSGKMGAGRTQFDVAQDHVQMLKDAMRKLAVDGTLWFSCHRRDFRLDDAVNAFAQATDITEEMIPADFAARRPFRVWCLTHRL